MSFRRAAALALVPLSACAILQPYNDGITPVERLEECRLLDRKVTEAGQLNAVGTFLAGGAGLAAGVADGDSEAYGILSGAFGLFAAFSSWAANRHNERFNSRQCALILNPDPENALFRSGLDTLQVRLFILDSLKAARARVREQSQSPLDTVSSQR
jgi:hypothetical protein